jgi:enolase-phosphatase E1
MIRAVLTDIEGTTSSLSFVKDVLFPYSRRHLPDFVRAHQDEPAVKQLLADVRREANDTLEGDKVIAQLLHWIDEDRKATPLKALQGMIWETGYRHGDFHGHIYPDALERLRAWRAAGLRLYVFSSGSIKAQQLLFGHTAHGDLTPMFAGYFDTTIGAKRDPEAYRRIAAHIGLAPQEILFLSDIKEELDAARAAGMPTYWLVRANSESIPADAEHPVAHHFGDIEFQSTAN